MTKFETVADIIAERDQLRSYAEALNARCVEDTQNSERYRWLQASKSGTIRLDGDPAAPNDMRWAAPQYVHWGNGSTLDDAVDAAMTAARAVGAA